MTGFWDSLSITEIITENKALTLSYKWDITVSAQRDGVLKLFDVFPLFATALRPVFVNFVYPRGQISVRLFYIQSIPILTI